MSLSKSSCLLILLAATSRVALGIDYYVSPTGSDSNAGTSSSTPWASLSKASSITYQPGDRILLQRGGEWRDRLDFNQQVGTASNPIVVDAYGTGAKPKIWGSDPIANNNFRNVAGSTYVANVNKTVNSFLADHSFYSSAYYATNRNPSELANIAYVKSNPNTWYQTGDGKLYINTGGPNPKLTTQQFSAAVREDLVNIQNSEYVTVKNIVADESAKHEGGYAFRTFQSNNVSFEDSEAYRAGKHHFGAINTKDFYGKNLYSAYTMPGQQSTSAYVSYSDHRRVGDTSVWENIVGEKLNVGGTIVDTFYCHADTIDGITSIVLKNVTARGAGIGMAMAPGTMRIEGGSLELGATMAVNTNGAIIDGLQIGDSSYIYVPGENNIFQNLVAKNFESSRRYSAVLDDQGKGNVVRFSTFDIASGAAIASVGEQANTEIYGNIFKGNAWGIMDWSAGENGVHAHDNLYSDGIRFLLNYPHVPMNPLTAAQFAALGYDVNSIVADPMFVDWLNGNLELQSGSPAIGYLDASLIPGGGPLYDFNGNVRGLTGFYNLGAYEGPVTIPEPTLLLPASAAILLARRFRTSRR